MAQQHFNGKNHKAKLAALQEGGGAPAASPLPVPTVQEKLMVSPVFNTPKPEPTPIAK